MAQWLRIRLPMQGTQVRALVWEDPTCLRATRPVRHNYWACALEPASHNYWSPRTWSLCTATKSSHHSPQLEKDRAQQRRPNATKKKKKTRQANRSPIPTATWRASKVHPVCSSLGPFPLLTSWGVLAKSSKGKWAPTIFDSSSPQHPVFL